MSGTATIERITERARFDSVAHDWDSLVRAQARPRLHLSSDWIAAWWDCFGADSEVHMVMIRSDGALVAAAPMLLRRKRFGGAALPIARLLGNVFASRSDILIRPAAEPMMELIVDELCELDWWLLDTGRVPLDSAGIGMLVSAGKSLVSHRAVRSRLHVPRIAVAGDWKSFLADRSANFRKTIRRATTASRSLAVLRFPEDLSDIERLFDHILAVSRRTWKHAAGTSLAADADAWRFFSRVLADADRRHALHARLLVDGSVPVAFITGIQFAGTIYASKLGYDEAYAEASPGFSVLTELVRDAFELEGVGAIDLDCIAGRGDYKARWATELETFEESYLFRRHVGGAILGYAHGLARRARRLRGSPAPADATHA